MAAGEKKPETIVGPSRIVDRIGRLGRELLQYRFGVVDVSARAPQPVYRAALGYCGEPGGGALRNSCRGPGR
jgi:hypothetical protein